MMNENSELQGLREQLFQIRTKLNEISKQVKIHVANQDYHKITTIKEQQHDLYLQIQEIQLVLNCYKPKDQEQELYNDILNELSTFN